MIKSGRDSRDYEHKVLDNGLSVIAISDKDTNICSAALSINIGSYYDKFVPCGKEFCVIYGLAHFLEHMLFLGSQKYPDEGYYSKLVSKYGGSSNAYTDSCHTCYYFSSSLSGFAEILDVFAQFFISPLFTDSALMREISSVNSEHDKNRNDDSWREYQILRSLAKPSHIFNSFATGSNDTLNVVNIRERIIEFFNSYYVPTGMNLVLYGKESTAELLKLADVCFSAIPARERLFEITCNDLPFSNNICILVEPINDVNTLQIIWQIPNLNKYVYSKWNPMGFISHVLDQKMKGGIYEHLRQYISSLTVEPLDCIFNVFLFAIEVELTTHGLNNINYVVSVIYSYIDMFKRSSCEALRGIYGDISYVKRLNFEFQDDDTPLDYTVRIAGRLAAHKIPVNEVLIFCTIYGKFNVGFCDIVREVLGYFVQENSVVMVSSKHFKNIVDRTERWYGARYSVLDCNVIKLVAVNNLSLPGKNKYISRQLMRRRCMVSEYPERVEGDYELWYQCVNDIPYVKYTCQIILPKLKESIITFLTFKLYIDCVIDVINADLSECLYAGYDVEIALSNYNLMIDIYGPSEKIGMVLDMIVRNILYPDITPAVFVKVRRCYAQFLENCIHVPPYASILNKLLETIEANVYSYSDMLSQISFVSYQNVINIKYIMFSHVTIRSCIIGNITRQEAVLTGQKAKRLVINKNHPFVPQQYITCQGQSVVSNDSHDGINCAIGMFYCIEYIRPGLTENWNVNLCLVNLLNSYIEHEYYNQLRTNEQLGYVVTSNYISVGPGDYPFLVYGFVVQSSNYGTEYLIAKTEKFIQDNRVNIGNDLEGRKKALVELLKEPNNLRDVAERNVNMVFNTDGVRDMETVLAETYNKITREDVVKFYDKYIYNQRAIVIRVEKQ